MVPYMTKKGDLDPSQMTIDLDNERHEIKGNYKVEQEKILFL
jgi:hypothetical protein